MQASNEPAHSRSILITGANRGLGLEFARQYATDGWRVVATCRDPGAAQELSAIEGDVRVEALDVADFAAIDALAAKLADQPIDVLLSNAGLFGPKLWAESDRRQNFGSIDFDIWSELFRVNTMAPVKLAEAFLPHLLAGNAKKIAIVTSSIASITNAEAGVYAYRSSKSAANMVSRTLSLDLAQYGIAVVALCPGWVRTRMGGENAPLDKVTSIEGVRSNIEKLTPENSGRFVLYDGSALPW